SADDPFISINRSAPAADLRKWPGLSGDCRSSTAHPQRLPPLQLRSRSEAVAILFTGLPPRTNAIDAAIGVATGIMTDCRTRDGPWPQHDAGSRNAACRIVNIWTVYDRRRGFAAESHTRNAKHCAAGKGGERESRNRVPHDCLLIHG